MYSGAPLLVVAYNGVGRRIGACCTTIKVPPHLPLRRPREQANPADKEEDCDDKARRARDDRSDGGRDAQTLSLSPSFSLLYSIPLSIV